MKMYLGDGLYAEDDGYTVILKAQRDGVWHWVAMESDVLCAFLRFIERSREVKLEMTVNQEDK